MKHVRSNFAFFCLFSGAILLPNLAHGDGMLDFADPCKATEKQFDSTSSALRTRADATIAEWESMQEPPGELRPHYVEAIRKAAYQAWTSDPTVVKLLETLKGADPTFDPYTFFIGQVYPQVVNEVKEAELVRTLFRVDYEANLKPQFEADRKKLDETLDEQKSELDSACKPDVFNQVFRATLGNLMLVVQANTEAAKNERGDLAKLVRVVSGVSIADIEKYGILGGENSELRKIAGGENSVVNQTFRALDPNNWEISVPEIKIALPDTPKIEPPTVTLPGGTRVCIPWC